MHLQRKLPNLHSLPYKALRSLPVKSVTLDGEGVVCDANGVSDFELLRAELGRNGSRVPFLYAFDVLEFDGRDLRASPWHERRATSTELLRQRRRWNPTV